MARDTGGSQRDEIIDWTVRFSNVEKMNRILIIPCAVHDAVVPDDHNVGEFFGIGHVDKLNQKLDDRSANDIPHKSLW